MQSTRIPLLFLVVTLMVIPPVFCQSGRPVIIRDTDIAEGIEDSEELKPKERDPAEAKDNIDVGKFYNKRKNYVGAIQRYLTALEYEPDSTEAYELLVKAYESIVKAYESIDPTEGIMDKAEEQHGQISVAINAFKNYLRIYPDSINADDLNKMMTTLQELASKRNIEIGNFNYENRNYARAIQRYLAAMEYQPDSTRAYELVVKAHESLVKACGSVDPKRASHDRVDALDGQISDALEDFSDFMLNNPDSVQMESFTEMIAKLEELSSRFGNL